MVQLGCALDTILLCVSAIISLELMAQLLGLGANGALKTIPCPLHVQIFLIVASIFYISAFYVLFGFGLNMMLLWVSASISQELLALSLGSEAPGSP